jgi:glutaminase-like protein
MGGDMTGARNIALRDGVMHTETLDIRTEHGRQEVSFGYEPGVSEPYFICLEGPEVHRFADLEAYHDFVEARTGERLEPIARRRDDTHRESGPDDFDDAPTNPDLPVHERPTKRDMKAVDPDEEFHALADERVMRAELDQLLLELGQKPLTRSEVTPAEAMDLHEYLSKMKFVDAAGAEAPVPFHYPVDGCWGRAHMMAEAMSAMGIESERVFATSTVSGEPLRVQSDFSQDQPGHRPPVTEWFYHVAPIVKVRTPAGIEYFVIDPSTQATAVPVREWLATMGVAPGSYRQMTHQELMAHLAADHPGPREHGFPKGEKLVWTTDPNTMYPTDPPAPDSTRSRAQYHGAHKQLSNYAERAAVSEVAAAVRQELRNPGATAASVIAIIRRGQPWSQWLQSGFGMLHAELMNRFKGDRAAIEEALKP